MSQKFCNILVIWWHNSTALDAFGKVMIVTNHIELWDAKVKYHSLEARCIVTSEPMLLGLPDYQGSCTPNKISSTIWLQYYNQLHHSLFPTTTVFACFWGFMSQFKLTKHKFLNYMTLSFAKLSKLQMEWSNAQCISTPTTNYRR